MVKPHNEWFHPLAKKVCACGQSKHKLRKDPVKAAAFQVVAWGEYVYGKFRTVDHVCPECVDERMISRLFDHLKKCGCAFAFKARCGYSLPEFIKAREARLNQCSKSSDAALTAFQTMGELNK